MPAKTTRETINRQWEILKILPTIGAGITARDLARRLEDAGFKVSKRQVERDLIDLEGSFPIDCNSAGTPYGWRWAKNANINIPGMSVAEALSLKLIEETLEPLLPKAVQSTLLPRFKQAQQKLTTLAPNNPKARWFEKVKAVSAHLNLIAPVVEEETLTSVQEALLIERKIEISYRNVGANDPKPFTLHPLGLISRGNVQYLVATAFEYEDPRLYALHRMTCVDILSDAATQPQGFTLNDYIESGATQFVSGEGKNIRLKAVVSPSLQRILEETPLSEDQGIKRNKEEFVVSATVIDSWQLRWWILSHGSSIRVLSPKSLAKSISEELLAAANAYLHKDKPE